MTHALSIKTFLLIAVAALLLPMTGHSQSAPALPAKMHWCAVNCITLVLYHGHYVAENNPHPEQSINCGLFTVETFTRESVVIHRTDCEPPGTAVLTGKISSSGNAIVDGIINWTSHPCCGTGSRSFHAAWGSEIDSIPGGGVAPLSLDQPPAPAAAQNGASVPADALVAKVNAALAASTAQPANADTVGVGQVQIENVPALIDECEEVLSRKNCATWKWNGAEYVAIWGDGTVAHMTVQQMEPRRRHSAEDDRLWGGPFVRHLQGSFAWRWVDRGRSQPAMDWGTARECPDERRDDRGPQVDGKSARHESTACAMRCAEPAVRNLRRYL